LENVMQRALVLCDGDLIRDTHIVFEAATEEARTPSAAHAPPAPQSQAPATLEPLFESEAARGSAHGALAQSLALAEQKIILEALRSSDSRERVAKRLGISPRTLRYKVARLRDAGIDCGETAEIGGDAA